MRNTKALLLLLLMLALLSFASCGSRQAPEENSPPYEEGVLTRENEPNSNELEPNDPESSESIFEGMIAIIPYGFIHYPYTAMPVVEKYGENKVTSRPWIYSGLITEETPAEAVTHILPQLGASPEIKAFVINTVCPGIIADFEILRKERDDIYIIYCEPPYGDAATLSQIADLILVNDEFAMCSAMARQAARLRAGTLVYYSYPMHADDASYPVYFAKRTQIEQQCAKLGIEFIDIATPNPQAGGEEAVIKFIQKNVPKMVEKYGKDTAFFATECFVQIPLVEAIIETGAIYPQPCCFSSANAISAALGLKTDIEYLPEINDWTIYEQTHLESRAFLAEKDNPGMVSPWADGTKAALAEKGMLGRLSTWPVYDSFMYSYVGAEYAVKWINGEVPKEGVDVKALKQLMEDYAGVEVYLTLYTDEYPYTEKGAGTGETYDNILLVRMDYITFE
jgi:hypothetical protein